MEQQYLCVGIPLSIILVGKLKPQDKPAIAETAPKEEEELPSNPEQKDGHWPHSDNELNYKSPPNRRFKIQLT
jgi:hypothetical protein